MLIYDFLTAFLCVFLWVLGLIAAGIVIGVVFITFLRTLRRFVDWLEALVDNRLEGRAKAGTGAKATAKAVR